MSLQSFSIIIFLSLAATPGRASDEERIVVPYLEWPATHGYLVNSYPIRAKNLERAPWWYDETKAFVKMKLKSALLKLALSEVGRAAAEAANLDSALEIAIANGLEQDILASKYELNKTCTSDDGLERAGTAVNGERGGTICLALGMIFRDLDLWQSMVVKERVIALALHEHLRHVGIFDSDHVLYNRARIALQYIEAPQPYIRTLAVTRGLWEIRRKFKNAADPLPLISAKTPWTCKFHLLPELESADPAYAGQLKKRFGNLQVVRTRPMDGIIEVSPEFKGVFSQSSSRMNEWSLTESSFYNSLTLVARSHVNEVLIELTQLNGDASLIRSVSGGESLSYRKDALGYLRCAFQPN